MSNYNKRLRRSIQHIQKSILRASTRQGQTVLWYEFDPTSVENEDSDDYGAGFDNDLYDEGGVQTGGGTSRRWKAAKTIQVFQAILNEGAEQFTDVGTYEVDDLTLIVSADELRAKGIAQPKNRGDHTDDRVVYDNRIFSVDRFNPRGRIADAVLTVTVGCKEVKSDEQVLDDVTWHA